jgi:two-component system sensor histidine kinase/response regulator
MVFTFLEEVRKEDRWVTVPFIFLTAKGEKTDRHRGSLAGADVYLTKPFDAEDLLVSVSSCLKRYGDVKRVKQDEIGDVKNKILTILNHEFRTPLTLVVAYADMLKDYDGKNMEYNEIRTFLHGVNAGAETLATSH